MTHYRKELKFSWESLEAADNAFKKLKKKFISISENRKERITLENLSRESLKYKKDFVFAMHDDLNTSVALSKMWALINDKNIKNEEKYTLLIFFDKYFRLNLS